MKQYQSPATLHTATVIGSAMSSNYAHWGGGICNRYGTATLEDSFIRGNYAASGGGIWNYASWSATTTLEDTYVFGNAVGDIVEF